MLFSEEYLGCNKIKNRYVLAPMTRVSANPDGSPNQEMLDYYVSYALGGFGLIITEGTYIDEASSQGYKNQPGIANTLHEQGWQKIVDSVHKNDVPIFQQLLHAGALMQHNAYSNQALAPSEVQPTGEMASRYIGSGKFPTPLELTTEQIHQIIDSYGKAATHSINAGFDGIEVHGANGYLPDQFLTNYTNLRTDEFGGEIGNRILFHCKVIKKIRENIGSGKTLGVRISQTKINDFNYEWPGQVGDAEIIFEKLAEAGADYIHISTHLGLVNVFESDRNLASFAKEFSGLKVIACGGLHDQKRAENLLESGDADFIAVGKAALSDPSLPNKILNGVKPLEFDQGMISPVATIKNTHAWKKDNT